MNRSSTIEPAHGDTTRDGVQLSTLDERPQEHDRAGDRDGETEHEAAGEPPAERDADTGPDDGAIRAPWMMAPGTATARTASRSGMEKWMPTPNMSSDHADLRQLRRPGRVRRHSRRCRAR